MLLFSTKIPVYPDMSEEEFIYICSEWVYNSPHYHNIEINYDLSKKEDYSIEKDNITCMISCYNDENADITAFRLINAEDDNHTWTIDFLFICEGDKKFVSVQNNLDSKTYNYRTPKNRKPNFI